MHLVTCDTFCEDYISNGIYFFKILRVKWIQFVMNTSCDGIYILFGVDKICNGVHFLLDTYIICGYILL